MFPDDDPDQPVTVLWHNDPGVLALAQSLLEEAGIEFFIVGAVAAGLYPGAIGPDMPEIRVAAKHAVEARDLLKDLG